MTTQLAPLAVQRFYDNAGNVAVGGLLYTYQAGTTTPQATYTDSTGGTPNANPIILNSRGEAGIWLTPGQSYKFVLKDAASNTLWTVDNITGPDSAALSLKADLASTADASKGPGMIGGVNPALNYVFGTLGWELYHNAALASWWGVKGDGSTNDTTALANAIAGCQVTLRNLRFAPGSTVILNSTTTLSGNPITFIGEPFAVRQQGSTRPSVTLRWTGGASPMFTATSSAWRFIGLAAENFGSATDFFQTNNAQQLHVEDCSFVVGSGASQFSRSIFGTDSNGLGYSKFIRTDFQGAAPNFIYVNGNGSPNGITQIEIDGGLYESNSTGSVTVFKLIDCVVTSLIIRGATFNQQANELCLVDTTGTPRTISITNLVVNDNEFDTPASSALYRKMRLTNVKNASIDDNYIVGGGVETALAELVNTTVTSFWGNYWKSVNGPFFNADTLSRVYPGMNQPDVLNTKGIINDTATGSGIIPLTYGTTVTILGQYAMGTGGTTFSIDVTNGTGWTLSFAHPGIGAGGFMTRGQQITVMVRNVSGGAMGAITLAGAYFKLSGGAFPVPANGNSRSVTMVWNGSAFVEVSRTPADVPN